MIHVFDKKTGALIEVVSEGSNVSRFNEQGFLILTGRPSCERGAYRLDESGQPRPVPPDEIATAQAAADRGRLEGEIVDLRVRADAATAEGFTGLAGALQAEMTARRAGLEKL